MYNLIGLLAAAGMVTLILDPQTAFAGASEGLSLCLQTVIPSLFPFFLLSDLLINSVQKQTRANPSALCRLWKIPRGAEGILLAGLLGGYPVGARCVSQACEAGSLSRDSASRMLVFCNACGPAFLFGIGCNILGSLPLCLLTWGILLLGAYLTSLLLPGKPEQIAAFHTNRPISLTESANRAVKAMTSVCAWIVLFRVALHFLDRWMIHALPDSLRIFLCGITELTNGCISLKALPSTELRFILFTALTSLGGLCVMLQTLSVLTSQIPHRLYFPGKLFQSGISTALAWLVQLFFPNPIQTPLIPAISITFSMLSAIFMRKSIKNSSISQKLGV